MYASRHQPTIPRFARVTVKSDAGEQDVGTTVWFDREYGRHVVLLSGTYRFLTEAELVYTGTTVPPATFIGKGSEISFDVVGPGGGRYSEGCLRRAGTFWECFSIRSTTWQEGEPWLPRVETRTWASGIVGHLVEVDDGFDCTHAAVASLLADLLGVDTFEPVRGPASIWLK